MSRAHDIATDFATIQFEDHEARILALAYLRLEKREERLLAALGRRDRWIRLALGENAVADEVLAGLDTGFLVTEEPVMPEAE